MEDPQSDVSEVTTESIVSDEDPAEEVEEVVANPEVDKEIDPTTIEGEDMPTSPDNDSEDEGRNQQNEVLTHKLRRPCYGWISDDDE